MGQRCSPSVPTLPHDGTDCECQCCICSLAYVGGTLFPRRTRFKHGASARHLAAPFQRSALHLWLHGTEPPQKWHPGGRAHSPGAAPLVMPARRGEGVGMGSCGA